ncbi:MAG: hypothetical protein JW727_05145 [Candidatus Aenigmarchaeota archaeon]|nr:hypothetical protein [Candidatus Aenigmarchaeota archaeon]
MALEKPKSIANLQGVIKKLSKGQSELFDRLYALEVSTGNLEVPSEMESWTKQKFGSVKKVKSQKIVHLQNRLTGEGTLFNELRASRPFDTNCRTIPDIEKNESCLFCNASKKTPPDTFGRLRGKHCMTSSNIAKYDQFHGVIIFNEHNPLKLKKEWLLDYLEVAEKWFGKAASVDPLAKNDFLIWNCLWKSGASLVHGHMQLTASRTKYGQIRHLEEVALGYREIFGRDYFEDLFEVHKALGLGKKAKKERLIFYLTPKKEKEILILSKSKRLTDLALAIFRIIEKYKKLGVQSYNLAVFKALDYWIMRIVDRGALDNKSSDIGTMELFADAVVSSDPFRLAEKF